MKIEKKTIYRIFLCVLGCIAFYWLLHETDRVGKLWNYIDSIFSPFIVGGVIAFILNVPMRAIENRLTFIHGEKVKRVLAILLTVVVLCLAIYGIILLLIPQISSTVTQLFNQLPVFFESVEEWVMNFLEERPELMQWVNDNIGFQDINWSALLEKVAAVVSDSMMTLLNGAIAAVSNIFDALFNLVISVVFAFYCLACKETLARQSRKVLYALCKESRADQVVRVMRMTNVAFSNFFAGQCLEALILALLFVVPMMLLNMPYIPLICVLIAVTALVPMVGAFVGCGFGAFFILVNDPAQAVVFVILFVVIQQIENNLIYPKVVGQSIGLPGMWVLMAVAVGGSLSGVVGMFMMVPLSSVLYTLMREFTHKRLEQKEIDPDKLREHPPELESHFRIRAKNSQKVRVDRKLRRKQRKNQENEKEAENEE